MSSYFDPILGEWRERDAAAGSGGGGAGMVEVVSGGSVGYIPVLSGGMCYRFTDPLVSLTIGSVTSSLRETDILFTAGAVVSPPASVKVKYQNGANGHMDDETGEWIDEGPVYTAFTLTSSGGGYACAVPANGVGLFNYEWWDPDWNERNFLRTGSLSGGSFTCTSAGGKWVISAHGIVENWAYDEAEWDYDEDTGEESWHCERYTDTKTINTWVASSTDGMVTWTVNNNAALVMGWETEDGEGEAWPEDSSPTIEAPATVTPCDVVVPSGTLLVNSSAITVESGHRYEMNVKYGAIVTGEWQEIGE